MIETNLTRVYLESLSSGELLKLADRFNVDIPAGLERILVIEELLESAYGNEERGKLFDDLEYNFLEAAALPKQYNISFIDVMIRDPLWAFVFWEIKNHDREAYEKQANFDGYCLIVIPINGANSLNGAAPGSKRNADDRFIVPINLSDSGLYLNFPPAEGLYRIELCAVIGGKTAPLIISGSFRLPNLPESQNQRAIVSREFQDIYNSRLACLSGALEFPVIRNSDRLIRAREIKSSDDA